MPSIDRINFNILNRNFQAFQERMILNKSLKPIYVISQLNKYEKEYKKLGLERGYAGSLFTFANLLEKTGHSDIPGMIYSSLIKMPFLAPNVKEHYVMKALEYSRKNGDIIHEHARLVDLKILYKQTKQKHKYKEVLISEEEVLKEICSNFREAKENFRTYTRGESSIKKYKLELAKTRIDISKFLMGIDPNKATVLLKKAHKTFTKYGKYKEADFANLMLLQIEERKNQIKNFEQIV